MKDQTQYLTSRRKFIKRTSLATLGPLLGLRSAFGRDSGRSDDTPPAKSSRRRRKSKRDLMTAVLDETTPPNYIPAGFFMHFGVRGDAAVRTHLDYFRHTGMDFVKIQFDEQQLQLPPDVHVTAPHDWAKIPVFPEKWFEPSLYLLKHLVKEAKSEALIIQTLFSPYQMAKQAIPWAMLVKHVQEDAESVSRGMENLTLSLMNFAQAAARLGVDGFYTCSQGGETNRVADRVLFNRAIKNYDLLLYKEAAQLVPYNIMHICDYDGAYQDFKLRFQDYPGQVVNVPLSADGQPLSLREAAEIFKRPVMGGLNRLGILSTGNPEEVKQATLEVLKDAPANMILSADCTVNRQTPMENLQAAINAAHEYRA